MTQKKYRFIKDLIFLASMLIIGIAGSFYVTNITIDDMNTNNNYNDILGVQYNHDDNL